MTREEFCSIPLTEMRIRILKQSNEYILADPLPEGELDVILRDESFEKPVFFNGKTFLFDEFNHLIKVVENLLFIALIYDITLGNMTFNKI